MTVKSHGFTAGPLTTVTLKSHGIAARTTSNTLATFASTKNKDEKKEKKKKNGSKKEKRTAEPKPEPKPEGEVFGGFDEAAEGPLGGSTTDQPTTVS